MSQEVPNTMNGEQDLKASIKEKTIERIGWINDLAVELGGEGERVKDVLPEPTAVRDEAPMPDWTSEQIAKAREVGQRFGYGAEQDVPSGLSGGVAVAEGGKVWKIMAEAEAIKVESNPTRLIFAGSAHRRLGEDELTFLKGKHGAALDVGATEYDAARWVARRQAEALADEPEVLPFGYEVSESNPMISGPTGQLVRLGRAPNGPSVELLRIDREDFEDEAGEKKFRNQPTSDRVMSLVSEMLAAEDDTSTPVIFLTSNTYASKSVDQVRNGLKSGRQFGVALYGRQTIINLGAPVPAEMPLHHLPGDLRAMHDKLQQLLSELA
jgi:hypothetical protein